MTREPNNTPPAAECEPAPVPVPNGQVEVCGETYVNLGPIAIGDPAAPMADQSCWSNAQDRFLDAPIMGWPARLLDRIHAQDAELVKLRAMVDDCRAIFKAISDVASEGLTAIPRVMDHAEFVRICIEEREKKLRAEVARLQGALGTARREAFVRGTKWQRAQPRYGDYDAELVAAEIYPSTTPGGDDGKA